MTVDDVIAALGGHRFIFASEAELQETIAATLSPFGAKREAKLGDAGRIDFLIGRVGVEVKVAGSLSLVAGQVMRYIDSGAIDALLLVTTKHAHMRIAGKRLGVDVRVRVLAGGIS